MAEDQILHRHGGASDAFEMTDLSEQAAADGTNGSGTRSARFTGHHEDLSAGREDHHCRRAATSVFFLKSGAVHVRLPSGIRLATVTAGMTFGEMALLEAQRPADIYADAAATALEVPLRDFERFREINPGVGEQIMRNLAQLLADRLMLANAKLNLLAAT